MLGFGSTPGVSVTRWINQRVTQLAEVFTSLAISTLFESSRLIGVSIIRQSKEAALFRRQTLSDRGTLN